MPSFVSGLIWLAAAAPLVTAVVVGLRDLLGARRSEAAVARAVQGGLLVALLADLAVLASAWSRPAQDLDQGAWLRIGTYQIPLVLRIDALALAFACLSSALTLVIARFSRTYMHKEPGFLRFHLLLGLFAAGTQLVSWAGSLDLLFAGWELLGLTSALYIGFFAERAEPARSSLRAFATYRLCDAGFLLAIVMTHELVGSTRLSDLAGKGDVTPAQASVLAGLFLVSAMGKSAQLPFSGWLPRAMEGPTPSSALFYGALSLHAGLFLLLRTWTTVQAAPGVMAVAVVVGLFTAAYAALVARVQTDAKGTLAHATLSQAGLVLAEIALGWTTLALWHIVGHALLRAYQYLRAPNAIHDAHRLGHAHPVAPLPASLHARALNRLRLDDALDAAVAPFVAAAKGLDRVDRRLSAALGDDDEEAA
jgi:NADH:ubiquinone oxidoreductase subunit 5 (subunit L)/multisubunit Na+/H+ antiporter MnhA subunit